MKAKEMTIKKAYAEIVSFLEANEDKKVKTIIDQVREMASAKVAREGGSTYLKDTNGNTVAILDYYFKRWMPLIGEKSVEFGAKKSTSTGFNTMSKAGVSAWTKQQREAKTSEANLLAEVSAGNIQPSDIPAKQAEIEEARKAIEATDLGFETREEVVAYLQENGVQLASSAE